jgi:protein-L-isoaspartate O-methyltransferase
LLQQLKVGGTMVFPLEKGKQEYMVRLRKNNLSSYTVDWLYSVVFVPFIGAINEIK